VSKAPQGMMWYPEAWLSSPDVMVMSPEARSGYFDILCAMWLAGGRLKNDDKTLQLLSRLDRKTWRKVRDSIVSKLHETEDGFVQQSRLSEEFARTEKLLSDRKEAGKAGAKKRWGGGRPNGKANGKANGGAIDLPPGLPIQTETETETRERGRPLSTPPNPPVGGPDECRRIWDQIRVAYPNGHNPKPALAAQAFFGRMMALGGGREPEEWAAQALADLKAKWLPAWKAGRMVPDLHTWARDYDPDADISPPNAEGDEKLSRALRAAGEAA